jgi:protein-tyrosine phosphatase
VPERLIPLDGPANFRDLGGYETHHGAFVRSGRVFRSDSLSFMTEEDVRHVTEELGLRTVIDLRAGQEVEQFTHGPLESLPITVWHLPIVDETRREDEEHDKNAWANGEVIPLDELYLLMLNRFGHRFAAVLEIIAAGDTQPVVFHCAAGKDRTGLVAMLVLGLLGVDPEIIAADYALTDSRMPILLERHQARAAVEEGAVAEVAQQRWAVDATAMRAVIDKLVAAHGSVEGYVLAQGLSPDAIVRLRASLLEDPALDDVV